nr:MAG TPA: hypothetical protein [Caudoviricetes sp.]
MIFIYPSKTLSIVSRDDFSYLSNLSYILSKNIFYTLLYFVKTNIL